VPAARTGEGPGRWSGVAPGVAGTSVGGSGVASPPQASGGVAHADGTGALGPDPPVHAPTSEASADASTKRRAARNRWARPTRTVRTNGRRSCRRERLGDG